jgi:hypothetical protein
VTILSRTVPRWIVLSAGLAAAAIVLVVTTFGNPQPLSDGGRLFRSSPFLGWYSSAADIANLSSYGSSPINTVVLAYRSRGEIRMYLKLASAYGIRVMLQPNPDWISAANWGALRGFIEEFRKAPAVRAWYLYDEPDHTGLQPGLLRRAYRIVKSLDHHPVAVVFMSGLCRVGADGIDRGYVGAFDIFMFDYYPFWVGDSSGDDLRRVGLVDRNCRVTARELHKPFILVLQGFGNGVIEDGVHWRDPTRRELATTLQNARGSGAIGVIFYADYAADAATRRNVRALIGPRTSILTTPQSLGNG